MNVKKRYKSYKKIRAYISIYKTKIYRNRVKIQNLDLGQEKQEYTIDLIFHFFFDIGKKALKKKRKKKLSVKN